MKLSTPYLLIVLRFVLQYPYTNNNKQMIEEIKKLAKKMENGTEKALKAIEKAQVILNNGYHDCHASPEDGCEGCRKIDDYVGSVRESCDSDAENCKYDGLIEAGITSVEDNIY